MTNEEFIPLTEKMKPCNLAEYIGQEQVAGPDMVLQQLLKKGHIPSMIVWGPPGCGKGSLANVIACMAKKMFDKVHTIRLSAVTSGVADIKEAINTAKNGPPFGRKTIVIMSEIHRFNKLQQDIFLPHLEAGTFILIGTTTENPSYSLNSALLSRCRIFELNKLSISDMTKILCRAVEQVHGRVINPQHSANHFNTHFSGEFRFTINQTTINWLAEVSNGNARVALNALELAIKMQVYDTCSWQKKAVITLDSIQQSLKQAHMLQDTQTSYIHYLYSALHKSIQASNATSSLYWLARIMAIKEDPVNISRRLVRMSCEDVGLADPDALGIAVHTMHGCQMIGMPECDVLLGQCVVYLCKAPKSRLMYKALSAARSLIGTHNGPQPSTPPCIRRIGGEGKVETTLDVGQYKSNILHTKEDSKYRRPPGLWNVDFFTNDFDDSL